LTVQEKAATTNVAETRTSDKGRMGDTWWELYSMHAHGETANESWETVTKLLWCDSKVKKSLSKKTLRHYESVHKESI
jgi:hypothetical protein